MNINISRWLSATRTTRHLAAAIAGLGLMTGLATGPAVATTGETGRPVTSAAAADTSVVHTAPPAKVTTARAADNKSKAPTNEQLLPRPVTAEQQRFNPTPEQVRNAKAIVKAGQDMKVPPRAQVIAVATALQESTLHNYGHLGDRNDHDSLGLFQQRPSSGWGKPEQVQDPKYAATAFYKGLTRVDGWQDRPLTEAAQSVQVSAYPYHYAKWEKMAADLVLAAHGAGPYADRR